ncbi:hypothetical protein WR25_21498 [Diploscapter pachys]|uniref:Uncharacterized protein n=1 Tax=Diploscapter pachys TaxID=2018661 RepID=A0A2A2M3B2_9BILA|nr:hypothetical protein WR25_21498 [Diploscapter pachys]
MAVIMVPSIWLEGARGGGGKAARARDERCESVCRRGLSKGFTVGEAPMLRVRSVGGSGCGRGEDRLSRRQRLAAGDDDAVADLCLREQQFGEGDGYADAAMRRIAPFDLRSVDRDAIAGQAQRVRHRRIVIGARDVRRVLHQDRKGAERRRLFVGAVQNGGGADLIAVAEDGKRLRGEIDRDDQRAIGHALGIPGVITELDRADIEDALDLHVLRRRRGRGEGGRRRLGGGCDGRGDMGRGRGRGEGDPPLGRRPGGCGPGNRCRPMRCHRGNRSDCDDGASEDQSGRNGLATGNHDASSGNGVRNGEDGSVSRAMRVGKSGCAVAVRSGGPLTFR